MVDGSAERRAASQRKTARWVAIALLVVSSGVYTHEPTRDFGTFLLIGAIALLVGSFFMGGQPVREERNALVNHVTTERPKVIQQVLERDEGKCRECQSPHGVDTYYVAMLMLGRTNAETAEMRLNPDHMVTLCPQHVRGKNAKVNELPPL